jgi:hypothetical protein
MVYLGSEQRVVVTGSSMKEETCEGCGAQYVYFAQRNARGGSLSFLGLDNAGAQQRAKEQAEGDLGKTLSKAHDLVQCPRCSRFHSAGIREKRMRFVYYAGIPLFFGLFPSVIYGASKTQQIGRDAGFQATGLLFACIAAGLAVVTAILWFAYNPNKGRFFPFPDRGRRGIPREQYEEDLKAERQKDIGPPPTRRAPRPVPPPKTQP